MCRRANGSTFANDAVGRVGAGRVDTLVELQPHERRADRAGQAAGIDDFRDEDPGRILHELRYGELAAFEERPHTPYYGNADATPLFVMVLGELQRWGNRREEVDALLPAADRALAQMSAPARSPPLS